MERIGGLLTGCGPSVLEALGAAGWSAGRRVDTGTWTRKLVAAGFELNDVATAAWAEFGELTIKSSPARVPSSSLHVDPVDACIDASEEARKLRRRYGENYSPLGMWSIQYRSYVAASGRVIAVGAGFMWQLGTSFAEALTYVVDGDGGAGRAERAAWL
ncbi:SUKH-3 domain-containing protein [Streptomyces anulatus]|uniref:SUKH-3 domain-containing protein n=1 Tax=Streptomyces anulatus TaxID=1892 RepID=UPI002E3616FE|nr:SUKH-3 domain-containing protein [Streptomyces anulatus]